MQASTVPSSQPEVEFPAGRLPKPPPKFIGPLKHLTANYQLDAAQQYCEKGHALTKGIGEEYPGWRGKPQFKMLVADGNTVSSYIDDAYDQSKWSREKNREIKHQARKFCTSAYRSSKNAEWEYVNNMIPRWPETCEPSSRIIYSLRELSRDSSLCVEDKQHDHSRSSSPTAEPRGNVPLYESLLPQTPAVTSSPDGSRLCSSSATDSLCGTP